MKNVLQNLMSVLGGEAAMRAVNFVALLYIARAYGGAVLGAYAACLAAVTVVVMFADNGLQTAAITRITAAGADRNLIFGQLTLAKTILLAAAALLLAGVANYTKLNSLFVAIGAWIALRTMLQAYSQLQMAVLKSVSRARWIGFIQSLHCLFLLAALWLSFKRGWGLFVLLALFSLGQFLEFLLAALFLLRMGIRPRLPANLEFWATLRIAAPFGIIYGLANFIIRADTLVLFSIVPLSEVGAFSAANSVLLLVYVSGWLLGSILLPEMVRLSGISESLKLFTNHWVRLVVCVTVPAALLASLVAPRAIVLLYGASFARSGPLASLMALACPLILLNSIYTTLAIATDRRSLFLGIYATTAAATLALDFLLGNAFGARGIALAIVIREAGMFLGFQLLSARLTLPATHMEFRASSGGNGD